MGGFALQVINTSRSTVASSAGVSISILTPSDRIYRY